MTTIVFIQVQGKQGLTEVELPDECTYDQLQQGLSELGIDLHPEDFAFVDEAEEPVERKGKDIVPGLTRGCRIHVTRCRKVKVTVHFLSDTKERAFAAGTRVRRVKDWAVKEFKLESQDAAEHVLQLCNSTTRPPTDTPLHELTDSKSCSVCFDLVPEKRVEG